MYTYNDHFFFSFRTRRFVLGPSSKTLRGVGTIRPLGSRCRRFGRDPCGLSRVACLLNCFGLRHGYGKSPGFRNIPRDDVSASPRGLCFRISPGIEFTHPFDANRKNMCTSCARTRPRGKHSFFFFTSTHEHSHEHSQHAESTTLKNCLPAASAGNTVRVWRIHLHQSAAAS